MKNRRLKTIRISPEMEMEFKQLIKVACHQFLVKKENQHLVRVKCRLRPIAFSRRTCIRIIHQHYPDIALKTLGEYFGGLDHSTVINAKDWVDDMLTFDRWYIPKYQAVAKAARIIFKKIEDPEEILA